MLPATKGGVMAFHAKDGLEFDRLSDGFVAVSWNGAILSLSASEWASVVASMSKTGETASSFREALNFHDGVPTYPRDAIDL